MDINMQPTTHKPGTSFSYSSATRTLVCLGQTFSNVNPSEIEDYRKKAAAHDKQTQAEQARKYQEKPQRRQPTKPAVYSEKKQSPGNKPQASKARGKKSTHRKKLI